MKKTSKAQRGMIPSLALWLFVFSTGWFVMFAELVGARVLTPYFGNTIYVWGSVIGIFLLALAIGYAMGGKLTQRFSTPLIPMYLAIIAGLYVAATPAFQDSLSQWLYNTGMHVKWAALLATSALYGIPMVLLGGVSPYCVQIATRTQGEAGSRAGILYAISTVGSFIGTLITSFTLIPAYPLSLIITASGIMIAAIAVIVALALVDRVLPAVSAGFILAVVIFIAAAQLPKNSWNSELKAYEYPLKGQVFSQLAPTQMAPELKDAQTQAAKEAAKYMPSGTKILMETETPYHHLMVSQEGPLRQMVFGKSGCRGAQTLIDLRSLSWHSMEYTHLSMAGLLFRPLPKRVCVIGIGGAVIPRAIELCAPGVQIDAVEIDPTVIKVAREYFYWRPSKNVRVFAQDGRSFINWALMNQQPKYDWIILDAYNDDYVPFHLTTIEFIGTVQRMLSNDGILAANLTIDSKLYGCEARTFKEVFGNVSAFSGHRSANTILVSQNGRSKPLTTQEAAETARKLHLPSNTIVDTKMLVGSLQADQNWSDNGPILTDLWAPVENMLQ